ncbi:uncharacterized protein BO97DRAFT_353181, partial [Aspergillus homomorphus CBS 101889]
VGYLQYTSVNGARRRLFEPRAGLRGTNNWAGARLCVERLVRITSKEWTEDPYFLLQSRLLISNILHVENILLYEADITTELLAGPRNPRTPACPIEWSTIRRKQVPYLPSNTFSGRLQRSFWRPVAWDQTLLTLLRNVEGVIELVRKRTGEPEYGRTSKTTRISNAG